MGKRAIGSLVAFASFWALAAGAWTAPAVAQQVSWQQSMSVLGVVDLAGPRSDGRFVVAANGRLFLLGRGGLVPFAQGPGGYSATVGEHYITLTDRTRLRKSHCSFGKDQVFGVEFPPARVVRVTRRGVASTFATLPDPSAFLSGITFDRVGTFGHRVLVTAISGGLTTVHAIDCRGRIRTITSGAPLVEGGIEVAPRSFGRLAGQLIGANEHLGLIAGFKRTGSSSVLGVPGLAAGGDVGVESVGFVPPGIGRRGAAFLADRGVGPGFPSAGTDSILRLSAAELGRVGVRVGDLLVATEAGAETVAVRCHAKACGVRHVASGPDTAHGEGHIVFRSRR